MAENNSRRHFTPEEKVAILRRHLLEKVPVSELCDQHGIAPSVFYHWQRELFENAASTFARNGGRPRKPTASRSSASSSSKPRSAARTRSWPSCWRPTCN